MAGTASLAKLSALWVGNFSAGTPDKALAFERFDRGCTEELIDTGERAAWGTLDHPERRVKKNVRRANPTIDLVPNPFEWENLLQWIFGAAPTGGNIVNNGQVSLTYGLANAAPERSIVHSDGFLPILITGVAVDRATVRGAAQQEVTLSLDCVGRDWTTSGVPAPTAARSTLPSFIFTEMKLRVSGTDTYKCRSFELSTFKNIDRDRFFNSRTLQGSIARDRVTTLRAELPWGLHYALWQSGAADGGVAVQVQMTMTSGGSTYDLLFDMPAVRANTNPLEYRVPDEVFLPWDAQAFAPDAGGPNFVLSDSINAVLTRPE